MGPVLFAIYVIISFCIGLWGRTYRFGFWGYFFASLLLSPLVGTLLVIASRPLPSTPQHGKKNRDGGPCRR